MITAFRLIVLALTINLIDSQCYLRVDNTPDIDNYFPYIKGYTWNNGHNIVVIYENIDNIEQCYSACNNLSINNGQITVSELLETSCYCLNNTSFNPIVSPDTMASPVIGSSGISNIPFNTIILYNGCQNYTNSIVPYQYICSMLSPNPITLTDLQFTCIESINECAINNGGCGFSGLCSNEALGFSCTCNYGIIIDQHSRLNKMICAGINECTDQIKCPVVSIQVTYLTIVTKVLYFVAAL